MSFTCRCRRRRGSISRALITARRGARRLRGQGKRLTNDLVCWERRGDGPLGTENRLAQRSAHVFEQVPDLIALAWGQGRSGALAHPGGRGAESHGGGGIILGGTCGG